MFFFDWKRRATINNFIFILSLREMCDGVIDPGLDSIKLVIHPPIANECLDYPISADRSCKCNGLDYDHKHICFDLYSSSGRHIFFRLLNGEYILFNSM